MSTIKKSGVMAALALSMLAGGVHAVESDTVTLNVTGTVKAKTCNIEWGGAASGNAKMARINIGEYIDSEIKEGSFSSAKGFSMTLGDCSSKHGSVKVKFTGDTSGSRLFANKGTAENVAIALYDGLGDNIRPGQELDAPIVTGHAYDFKVGLVGARKNDVVPGSVESVITMTLQYE